tara:strand:- start:55 stop:264 length:210 start_codon:yes stop_codon:yes gene_type:complete
MSFLKNMLAEKKEDMINEILSDEFQQEIVDKINKDYNIPMISEKTEEKVYNALYDILEDVLKSHLRKKL